MKRLISNSLNEKSVINNILAGKLNKLILLTGVFGTGKTEFGTQIARMLTCENLTPEGYCGECKACKSEIVSGINSFNADIHLLNMEKVSYEEMKTLVSQCVTKIRNKNEVYILDEFHLVDKKTQELWLAETAKLEDCYIIMTTTEKKSISEGIISRSVQIQMKQLAPLEAKQLIVENYPQASDKIIKAIIRKVGGSPRDLINTATFYSNAGLEVSEIEEHLVNANQQEVQIVLESLENRELFFESLKVIRSMSEYSVRSALMDILWDWLGATPKEREQYYFLRKYTEQQIMKYLLGAKSDPFLTILQMFKDVTARDNIKADPVMTKARQEVSAFKNNNTGINDQTVKVNKW